VKTDFATIVTVARRVLVFTSYKSRFTNHGSPVTAPSGLQILSTGRKLGTSNAKGKYGV